MKSHVGEDGRWQHRFRQSWLGTADKCSELARREHLGDIDKRETDAANVGTAVHSAIELCLQEGLDEDDTVEVFHREFGKLMADPAFTFVKYTEKSARAFGEKCTVHWHNEVLPTLPVEDVQTEIQFCVPFYEDEERVIELSGTIDYFDGELRDWKTSGKGPYEEWEYKRYAIQPTVYTFAAKALGLSELWNDDDDVRRHFEYVVMHAKGVHRFTVQRDERDWAWLQTRCVDWALLIEREMPSWPKNSNGWWCSPAWCSAWSRCAGAILGENPWNQRNLPRAA